MRTLARMLLPTNAMATARPRVWSIVFAAGLLLATSSAGAAPPESIPCQRDIQCPRRTYCDMDRGHCTRIRKAINVLYLVYRSSDRRFTELFGVYWHQKGKSGYRVGFPLYWHFWSPGEQRRMVLPFYFDHSTKDERHLVIPPVEVRRSADRRIVRVWPLLFHSRRGPQSHSTTVVPFVHYSRSGDRRTMILPPLLSYGSSDDHGSRGMVAGLIHWRRRGDRLGFGVLPLFWHRRSPKKRFTWVAPLNFQWSGEKSFGLLALPLLLHHHDEYSSTTLALTPPLYAHRSADRRRFYLPPLFTYHRTGDWKLVTLGPTWIRHAADGAGFGVPPLFADWNSRRRWLVLFPALWHHRDQERTTWVVGPGYYHRHRGPKPDDRRLSLGLAPLFFHSRRPGASSTTLLPLFSSLTRDNGGRRLFLSPLLIYERDREAQRRQVLVAPIYYHLRDRWRQLDLAPPLVARWHDRERKATTWVGLGGSLVLHRTPTSSAQVLFPLLWRFRNRQAKTHDVGLLPAFWHHSTASGSTTWVAPFNFYSRTRTDDDDRRSLVLAPLLFAGWSRHRRHFYLPPLLWHRRTPTRRTWVVVPGYYVRSQPQGEEPRTDLGLAPLFFYHRAATSRSVTLLPLFHHSATQQHRRFISLFFMYQRDVTTGRVQWGLTLPFYYRRRDSRYSIDVFPPFFARWQDRERKSKTLVIGGPAVMHESPAWRVHTLFPVLWDVTDRKANRRTIMLIPVGFHRRESDGRTLSVVGPLFHKRHSEGWSTGLVPLLFFGRDGPRRHQVLFPVLWRFTSPDRGFTLAGPLLFSRKDDRKVAGLLPLALFTRSRDHRSITLPPLLFHHRKHLATGERLTWVGLYSARRRAELQQHSLWPLVHYRRSGKPPGHTTRFSVIPLLQYRRTPDSRRLITLVGGFSKNADRTLAVIGPLYFRRSERTVTAAAIPLAFASWDRGHFSERHSVGLLPLLYTSRGPNRRSLYTPLFGFRRRENPHRTTWYAGSYISSRSPSRSYDALLPLMVHHRDHQRQRTSLFMLPYFGRWEPERSSHFFFPLLWHSRRTERSTTVVVPVLWDFHRRGVKRSTLVFPFYLRHRDEQRDRTTHLTHLLWLRHRPDGNDAVLFPVLWHFGGKQRASTVVFPLLWHFRRPDRQSTVLFPLYWDFTRGQMRTTVVVNTLYRRNTSKKTYDFHFIPLVRVQRKRPTDFKLSLLAGLFGYERIGADRFLKLFLIPIDLGRGQAPASN